MTRFYDLPIELAMEIVQLCTFLPGPSSLKNLSITSQAFSRIVQPILNKTRYLRNILGKEDISEKHECTHKLFVDLGEEETRNALFSVRYQDITGLSDLLYSQIISFPRAFHVNWMLHDIAVEPPFLQYAVVEALRSISPRVLVITVSGEAVTPTLGSLQDVSQLSVDYRGTFQPALNMLQFELAKLISVSPDLSTLELISTKSKPFDLDALFALVDYLLERRDANLDESTLHPPQLRHFGIFNASVSHPIFSDIAKRHLQFLESLSIFGLTDLDGHLPVWMWSGFQDQNIRLKRLSTDVCVLDPSFLYYIRSYNGLESLRLSILLPHTQTAATFGRPDNESMQPFEDDLITVTAERLVQDLLTHHSSSLSELILTVDSGDQWVWPLPSKFLDSLASFKALKCFGVTLNIDGLQESTVHFLLHFSDCLPFLETLEIHVSSKYPQESTSDYTRLHKFYKFAHDDDRSQITSSMHPSSALHEAIISYVCDDTTSLDHIYRIHVGNDVYSRRFNALNDSFSFVMI